MPESLYLSFYLYIESSCFILILFFSFLTVMGGLNYFPWKLNHETIGFALTGGLECDSCTMGKCLCEV